MTFEDAKREFDIRYYWWAKSEFERESAQGYSMIRRSKVDEVSPFVDFALTLSKDDQSALASSLLKRFHPGAMLTLGENTSANEQFLRNQWDDFRATHSAQLAMRGAAAKPRLDRPANRAQLRGMMAIKFAQAFKEFTRIDPSETGGLAFDTKCEEWSISTFFTFGRKKVCLEYSHTIFQPASTVDGRQRNHVLSWGICFTSWLGLSSQTEWENVIEEEMDVVSDECIMLCQRFCGVAPKLLSGLTLGQKQ